MGIAIDFDGTIADTNQIKSDLIKKELGLDIPPELTDRTQCISELKKHLPLDQAEAEYRRLSEMAYSWDYTRDALEVPGATQGIKELVELDQLYLITARKLHVVTPSIQWLEQKGLMPYFAGTIFSEAKDPKLQRTLSKQEICRQHNLSVLVDDDERHTKTPSDGLATILIKRGVEKPYSQNGIYVVGSWPEIVSEVRNKYK